MPSLRIEFPGSLGVPLAARLDLPDTPPRAFALFAHCFTCSKDSRAPAHIGKTLVEQGIALLRFDFTGLGGSEGEFENTSFSSNVTDLVAAADWLRREYAAPSVLIGHSFGGRCSVGGGGRNSGVARSRDHECAVFTGACDKSVRGWSRADRERRRSHGQHWRPGVQGEARVPAGPDYAAPGGKDS